MAGPKLNAPSGCSRIFSFILRAVQLISSSIVSGIVIYFISLLVQDHMSLPWTFIFLLVVSIISLTLFFASLCCSYALSKHPRFNIVLSCILMLLWTIAFGLLAWWSRGTLRGSCDIDSWEEDQGVRICILYKALFAFSLLGFISTLALVLIDLHNFRNFTARGNYNKMPENHGDGHSKPVGSNMNLAYTSQQQQQRPSQERVGAGRFYDSNAHVSHQPDHKTQQPLGENASYYDPHGSSKAQHEEMDLGYSAPLNGSGQDTSYHGASRV